MRGMEDRNRYRRESGQQGHTNAPRSVGAGPERVAQQPYLGSRGSASIPSASSGQGGSRYSLYGTQRSPLSGTSMPGGSNPYQTGYPQQEPGAHGFPAYDPSLVFDEGAQRQPGLYHNLPGNYDQTQYQEQRYTGSLGGVLPESLGDVPQPYVQRDLPIGASVASQENPSPYASLPYASQQSSANRDDLDQSFSSGMTGLPQPSAQDPPPESGPDAGAERDWLEYQTTLRQTFSSVRDIRLAEAGRSLLEASELLLTYVADLGLTKDDENRYQERLKIWNDFNNGWLAILHKQKEITQVMMTVGQPLAPSQSLLSHSLLEKMAKELTRLCDNVECFGLVDYQMGVWEEEIITMIEKCLDLIEGDNEARFLHLTGQTRRSTARRSSGTQQ